MSEHKSSRSRKPLVIGVTLGCVLIALCAAGVAYALHYSARALPNVSVAGQSVSGMTRDEIAQMVDQRAKAMQVNVVVEGHSTPLTLSDRTRSHPRWELRLLTLLFVQPRIKSPLFQPSLRLGVAFPMTPFAIPWTRPRGCSAGEKCS